MKNKYILDVISKMDLDQKIGALLTLGFAGTIARPHIIENIIKYQCGGLRLTPHARLFGSYIDPNTGKSIVDVVDTKGYKSGVSAPSCTASEYAEILDELKSAAKARKLGIPLHFSFDQEGGTSADYNFGNVNIFTKPMGIRAANDKKIAYHVARAVSRQSKAVGFNWIHSPVLDINTDPYNPEIYTRAYSDRVDDVIEYSIESCRGFKEAGMLATGKHFPGRGHSSVDAHFSMPIIDVDKDTMLKRELAPYRELIKLDLLPSVMIAHSIFTAFDSEEVATVSKKILTGLLRDELGFDGVIATDSMTMGGIAVRYGVANACALALEAGADLLLMKAENKLVAETIDTIKEFVASGRISQEELDKKVYRVLRSKYDYGMFDEETREDPEMVNRDKGIIQLSKLVARRSVLIAKEEQKGLTVKPEEKLLVVEQINKTPNNMSWHPGILFKNCLKYKADTDYIETAYTYDDHDKKIILTSIHKYDTIIFTNFYIRGSLSNNEFLEEIIKNHQDKKIIILTNTQYPLSVPKESKNVIITYSTAKDNMEVSAGVIFGAIHPEGCWPTEYKPKDFIE